jgi:trehalose 6-phosphate phosphatase
MILAKRHLPILTGFALSNVLLALDYDGTLAPIAPTPNRARMRPETRRLLTGVAGLYPCVVISGRTLEDIAERLDGIPVWYVFGNHGNEPALVGPTYYGQTREWVRQLRHHLADEPGVIVEDKMHSVTIHYRQARNRERAADLIAQAVTRLPDARILGGREAVNLLPRGGSNKGIALQAAQRQFACDFAIYVGDDDTDEDAFAIATPDRLLSIRVGPAEPSRARFHLRSQADVDALLETLLAVRQPQSEANRVLLF